jgi:protease-4
MASGSSRRGVILVLVLIGLGMFVSLVAVLIIGTAAGPPVHVPSNASLYLRVTAPFAEVVPSDVLSVFGAAPPTLRDTIHAIRKAKADRRVKTLVLTPQVQGALWAQLQELRGAIDDFRTSGKPVTAFLEAGAAGEYYLASAADRIVMMPGGQLDLAGLATYELFFRGSLDKIGVYPDLLHIGEYKTATNTFVEKGFTPAHRDVTRSLNRSWYDELVRAIAASRKRPEAEIRAAIDEGPFLAEGAKRAGLVDALGYEDQVDDEAPVAGTSRLEGESYSRASVSLGSAQPGGRIALLYAVGMIASGRSASDATGGSVIGSDTFVQWVRKVRVDPQVRAIVIRIDSPGGSAIASEVIWRELMLARDVKPLIVSMGDVAASGGYYMAVPAHAIVAQPGTITGSIGVATGKFVLKDTMEKLGVGVESVTDGRLAGIYSPFAPFSPAERTRIEEQMQAIYDLFVSRVAEGRKMAAEKVDAVAKGRVWTGRQAQGIGLVDELGGLDRALRIAKERAKMDPDKEVDVVVYPQPRSAFEILANPFGAAASSVELALRRSHTPLVPPVFTNLLRYRRGEPLAIMPNVFWR